MPKRDVETGENLTNPYIEINKGVSKANGYTEVNSSTFASCLEHLQPAIRDEGAFKMPEYALRDRFYSVYGVVGRTVSEVNDFDITSPPISKTLMGYLEERVLSEKLPKVYYILNPLNFDED